MSTIPETFEKKETPSGALNPDKAPTESILRLRCLTGEFAGTTWASNETLQVGRTPGMPLFLNDSSVSRWHAELAITPGGWAVRDLGSRNGTSLNGKIIGAQGEKVQPGDVLQFGNISVIVETAFAPNPNQESSLDDYQIEQSVLQGWKDIPDLEERFSASPRKGILRLFLRTGRTSRNSKAVHDWLKSILWESAEFFVAENAALLTIGEDANPLAVRETLALGPTLKNDWFLNHPLVRETFEKGLSLRGRDATHGRSVLSILLRTETGKKMGVLILIRNIASQPYQEQDLVLADALALGVTLSIESFLQNYHHYQAACASIFSVLTNISNWQSPGYREQQQRVTQVALLLAREFGLSEVERQSLRLAIPLCHLGLLGLRQDILNKPGALSAEEKTQLREHVVKGMETLEAAPGMSPLIPIIRNCHERWDGTGYPDGLQGEAIPLLARIVAIADAFSAMIKDRPYRKSLSIQSTLGEIRKHRGTQFDPDCVEALMRIQPKLESLVSSKDDLHKTVSPQEMKKLMARMTGNQKLNKPFARQEDTGERRIFKDHIRPQG